MIKEQYYYNYLLNIANQLEFILEGIRTSSIGDQELRTRLEEKLHEIHREIQDIVVIVENMTLHHNI